MVDCFSSVTKMSSELVSLEAEVKPTLLICHHLSHLLKIISLQIMCQFVRGQLSIKVEP